MDLFVSISGERIMAIIVPGIIFSVLFLVGMFLRRILFSKLMRWVNKTGSKIGDLITSAF